VTVPTSGSVTVTITPIDDTTGESAETVILTVNTGTGYQVGSQNSATLSIADNDGGGGTPISGGGGGGGGGCVAISEESPWLLMLMLLGLLALVARVRASKQ
jgi:hypothetical protein